MFSLWPFFTSQILFFCAYKHYVDGLVQERCKSIDDALELRLSCTNPSISSLNLQIDVYAPNKSSHEHDSKIGYAFTHRLSGVPFTWDYYV